MWKQQQRGKNKKIRLWQKGTQLFFIIVEFPFQSGQSGNNNFSKHLPQSLHLWFLKIHNYDIKTLVTSFTSKVLENSTHLPQTSHLQLRSENLTFIYLSIQFNVKLAVPETKHRGIFVEIRKFNSIFINSIYCQISSSQYQSQRALQ